jgi:hypothetical protein
MEQPSRLTIEAFLAVAEMIAAQLRIKEADRWSPVICQLKYVSFSGEFPEVGDGQFLWAAEQWLQSTGGKEFLRYPTWRELMAPLYRCENGLANRSWGFRHELPAMVQPSPQQRALLPQELKSIACPPDPANTDAYIPFQTDSHPLLPPPSGCGLTSAQWAEYLNQLAEEDPHGAVDQQTPVENDSRKGSKDRQVVDCSVQQGQSGPCSAKP